MPVTRLHTDVILVFFIFLLTKIFRVEEKGVTTDKLLHNIKCLTVLYNQL